MEHKQNKHGRPGKRRFGPPQGAKMGISEDERFIMPDFVKWRNLFFCLDCIFIITTLLFELVFFGISFYSNTLGEPIFKYTLHNVLLPSGINFIIFFLAILIRTKLPKDNTEMRQNFLPIIMMYFLCLNLTINHCNMILTLCIYVVPIFMTTIFSDIQLCRLCSRLCSIGAVISVVKNIVTTDGIVNRLQILFESIGVILLIIICTQIALAVLGMTNEQKNKLLNFTNNIKEAQMRAETANIAKSTFLANMSHEIRTPINAILGMDEMILRESRDAQITEYAENIYSASTSLLSLVNDVLDISKIESGKLEIVNISYDTASFIHDCCNMINERVSKKNLEFKIFCNPNLPSQLRGDEVHLRQIITNLLSNAAKYTEEGGITLSVDGQINDDKVTLTIAVKDTGLGIKEENLKTLFSQFTRYDMDKNRNIEGTGLGLSITKQLIELMGGSIDVESTYGEGSKFTVTVEQQIVNDTPMGNFQERYQVVSSLNAAYQQSFEAPDAKILVVDDVVVNLKVAVNLLKQTKIFVDTASSGKICLEKITQQKYDIIFMDHMMPELSGVDTYNKMKEMEDSLNKDTPVVMLTANAISGVKEEYLEIGFADYLSKPILGDKFERMILKHLPKEKVTIIENKNTTAISAQQNTAAEDNSAQKIALKLLQNFYQEYPKANISDGLLHYGQSANIYISALYSYCDKINTEPIIACYEEKNFYKYKILAHEIKLFSADNGLYALAKQAGELEDAAIKNDWEFIKDHHIAFVMECQSIINAVQNNLDRRKT